MLQTQYIGSGIDLDETYDPKQKTIIKYLARRLKDIFFQKNLSFVFWTTQTDANLILT